jgi:hypothetical protein
MHQILQFICEICDFLPHFLGAEALCRALGAEAWRWRAAPDDAGYCRSGRDD